MVDVLIMVLIMVIIYDINNDDTDIINNTYNNLCSCANNKQKQ